MINWHMKSINLAPNVAPNVAPAWHQIEAQSRGSRTWGQYVAPSCGTKSSKTIKWKTFWLTPWL